LFAKLTEGEHKPSPNGTVYIRKQARVLFEESTSFLSDLRTRYILNLRHLRKKKKKALSRAEKVLSNVSYWADRISATSLYMYQN